MSPPDLTTLRAGGPDCPSDLALDRLHLGELDAAQRAPLELHLKDCALCAPRMQERVQGFQALPQVDERALLASLRTRLAAQAQARPAWWRFLVPVAAATAAALLAVVLVPRTDDPDTSGLREKGALALHVFRLRGEKAEEAVSGERFGPGDRLRFVVDLPSDGYAAVLGVEQSGALYTAWPTEGVAQTFRAAGRHIELPGAVALDGSRGVEQLHLVHCAKPADPPACVSQGTGQKPRCPAGCILTSFELDKRP